MLYAEQMVRWGRPERAEAPVHVAAALLEQVQGPQAQLEVLGPRRAPAAKRKRGAKTRLRASANTLLLSPGVPGLLVAEPPLLVLA